MNVKMLWTGAHLNEMKTAPFNIQISIVNETYLKFLERKTVWNSKTLWITRVNSDEEKKYVNMLTMPV